MIQQRDCNRGPSSEDWRFRYYDREWNTLENVRHGGSVGHDLVPPSLGRIAVEQAEKISEALPIPFLRIDFYITLKEVILGEFTPQPGSYAKFSPTFDRMMGEAWDAAALRLEASAPAIDEVLRLFQKPNPND